MEVKVESLLKAEHSIVALSIIDPSQTYDANMGQFGLTTLYSRR